MFNNPYHMEQAGRMRQQELLQAQRAQDLARAAQTERPDRPATWVKTRALTRSVRTIVAHALFSPRSAATWLTRLFALSVLAALVLAPGSAAAAEHPGNSAGLYGRVAPGNDTQGGHSAVTDPGTDINLSSVQDPGTAGGHSGAVKAPTRSEASNITLVTVATFALIIVVTMGLAHRRQRRSTLVL